MKAPTLPLSLSRLAAALVALALLLASSAPALAVSDEILDLLKASQMSKRDEAVTLLAEDPSKAATRLLEGLLDNSLYQQKSTGNLVVAEHGDDGYKAVDPLEGTSLGLLDKSDLKKVVANNQMRKRIRGLMAMRSMTDPDVSVRRESSLGLLDELDEFETDLLSSLLEKEKDAEVRGNLQTALALKAMAGDDKDATLAAIAEVAGNGATAVRKRLSQLKNNAEDEDIKTAADKALQKLESTARLYSFFQTVFFGVSLGSVLVLSAIGLAITFGVMGVINMAHGEMMMLGAYTTYVIQQAMPNHIGLSLPLAVPAAFLVSGLVGVLLERGIIRFLYGRPLETLLATFGVSLILQQAVRTIFTPLNRSVATPEWMSGSWQINPFFSITLNRLYIIFFCLMVFAALFAVLKKTRLGLEVRAVTQNRAMARAMGTRASIVDALTFGLGSGIAGVAGVALSQLTNVGPNLGQSYIIDSFMVVVFGGVGNLWGTLLAGLSLGVANKALEPVSGAVLAKILILVFIILFIQKRPTGLFPQKGRAVEG